MHITFESESSFDMWNKTRRVLRKEEYELVGAHYNTESNKDKPWVLTVKEKKIK